MIYISVTMIIKKGKMEEFLVECQRIRPIVLAEPGCLMYDYTREMASGSEQQEAVDPNCITLYEKWESIETLNVHSEAPHMKEFVSRVSPMRESVVVRTGIEAF